MEKSYEQLKWEMNILDEFIEIAYEGLIIVDKEGKIVKFKYEKFLDVKEKDVIGKHVTEVIENTRLHIVLKTGHPEIGDIQKIGKLNVIASRVPIRQKGEIVGAVGTILFKDVREVKHMAEHLDQMKAFVKKYKGSFSRLNQAKYTFKEILTKDPQMLSLIQIAKRAATSSSSVYIEGKSGTGKEYFAHAIHEGSLRRYGPFVKINCASIPKDLLESELFGYEPGAFTGASLHGKIGKFELANGGTIFLDELSSMPLDMQAKLLRVIEERELERIGGTESIDLDVRFISASNENLEKLVKEGKFRNDLYYRLNVVHLKLPPLSERRGDIMLFANHYLEFFGKQFEEAPKQFSREAKNCMEAYPWPGNVREIRNVVESAVNLATGNLVMTSHLPENITSYKGETEPTYQLEHSNYEVTGDLKSIMNQIEREVIMEALEKCHGNRTDTAALLGIHRTALYKKMEKLQITLSTETDESDS